MSSPPEFLNAVIPKPYTILGLKLRPLSIGHLLLMEWQDLFWTREQDTCEESTFAGVSLDDLISGCLICSMRFREYQDFIQSPDLGKQLRKLGKNLDLAVARERLNLFIEYFTEGMEQPEIEVPHSFTSGIITGSPVLQCLRICLMSRLHVPAEETFDYPYRQALWDCFSLRESEGKLQIVGGDISREMMDAVAVCKEMNAQMAELLASSGFVPNPNPNLNPNPSRQ